MKKALQLILITLLTLIGFSSFGQSELFGDWKVSCPAEYKDKATIAFCSLCPTVQENASVLMDDFEMEINKDEIKLNMKYSSTPVKYKWEDKTKSIEFAYNKTTYKFNTLVTDKSNLLILKDKDGLILLLQRK